MLNATNEPAGHYQEQLPGWDKKWHDADPRRLYGDGTGRLPALDSAPAARTAWHAAYAADYLHRRLQRYAEAAAPRAGSARDYENGHGARFPSRYRARGWPVVRLSRLRRHQEVQRSGHYLRGRAGTCESALHDSRQLRDHARLRQRNMACSSKNKEFAHASGRFQVACYKEEIEASLRTPSYSGFEILDLHDYLGQGGALIGMLDAFWETKGYADPSGVSSVEQHAPFRWRASRTASTPLRDTFTADVEVAHFGAAPFANATSKWSVVSTGGKGDGQRQLSLRAPIPRGKGTPLGKVSVELAKLPAPAQYKLVVEVHGGAATFKNDWNFWLYPAKVDALCRRMSW